MKKTVMKKTPLYTAISTACLIGLNATTANAIDMSVTELHFTGGDTSGNGVADNFPLDCSAGPMGAAPAGNDCYATVGMISDATGDFGFFESVDPFFTAPWAAVGVAHFNGFDGSSSEDLNVAADEANITNGTLPVTFGAFTQTITPNPDGNPATTDFTYSGVSASTTSGVSPSPFSYTFTLEEDQVAWGTLFNWSNTPGISVLAIFDCGAGGTSCVPVNTLMANGPFNGRGAVFKGTGSNFAPVANDDSDGAQEGVLKAVSVLNNDVDRDDSSSPPITSPAVPTITLPSATSAKGGMLTVNGSTIEYTSVGLTAPDTDTFTYDITDASGLSSVTSATVTMTITALPNTLPVADDTAVNVDEDAAVDVLVANASTDTDSPAQVITFTSLGAATNGSVSLDAAETTITYTPNADYNGSDSFTFFVNDGIADSAAAGTITVTVDPVNDLPVCTDVSQATGIDTALDIATSDLVAACTDVDTGDVLSYVTIAAPVNGSIVDDGSGTTLTYTPASKFKGDDSAIYTVTDSVANATAALNIQVGGELLGNFTMLQSDGQRFGGTNDIEFTFAPSVDLDDVSTLNNSESDLDFNLEIKTATPPLGTPFFGSVWVAHHIRVFGPGTYSFDSGCTAVEVETTGCPAGSAANSGPSMSMTIPTGMVGGHMLFDWNGNNDLVVVNVWERNAVWGQLGKTSPVNQLWALGGGVAPDEEGTWELVSRDVNGDGFNGTPMVAGPFVGNYVNFNHKPSGAGMVVKTAETRAPNTDLGSSAMNPWVMLSGLLSIFGFRRYVKKSSK